MGNRKTDQSVDAFSAPKALLRAAQLEAKRRHMSKSGFYRYCLAKILNYDETAAMHLAEHASIGDFNVVEETPRTRDVPGPGPAIPPPKNVKYGVKKNSMKPRPANK